MVDIILILILALDFAISLWNAYTTGYSKALLNRAGVAAGSGL